jgi:hypothetical protein
MSPFASLPRTAATHFQLHFFGAALRLRERAPEARFEFLRDYCADADRAGLGAAEAWDAALREWEDAFALPLQRLMTAAGLDRDALHALFLAGLAEEDARFGSVWEAFTGHPCPTSGLLHAWWPASRAGLRRLAELGLVESAAAEASRADSPLRVPPVTWDAIRGDAPDALAPWARRLPRATLPESGELILAPPLLEAVRRAPAVLASGAAGAIVVRGPAAGGRRTVLGAIARAAGRGLLQISGLTDGDPRWRQVGPLATLLDALPAVVVDVASGETAHVPAPDGWDGPLGVVAGRRGGVAGPGVERAVTLTLDVPGPAERARHWAVALGGEADAAALAGRLRMTGGNIRRSASLARAEAALAGRERPDAGDVARGARALHGRLLDTLAVRVPTETDWDGVAVRPETMRELRLLEARCRHRERVGATVGAAAASGLTAGVRALFTGASGTGKTLAARTLAGVLGIDLYRVDLATVVNKYLGETEKNLDRLLSRAEEADAALLLDEGDALMTRRTEVQTSNDRYANLETNFLLQRLESFEGILLVTSNAGERIDGAFRRRMDFVVDFGPPDELERWAIWQLHLPGAHAVDDDLLGNLAARCALTGGQVRNAVLHASLLALEGPGTIASEHLEAAVRREYAKAGWVCPLAAEVLVG